MRRRVFFFDADDFHPAENVAKMRSGVPLTDADRLPWLQHLADLLARAEAPTALACSALKAGYRDRIAAGCPHAFFVHLAGAPEVIGARISARVGHYMPPSLLESQFGALGSAGWKRRLDHPRLRAIRRGSLRGGSCRARAAGRGRIATLPMKG